MKARRIRAVLRECIENRARCCICAMDDMEEYYYIPLRLSDGLLLGQIEDDFLLNGYTVRALNCIEMVERLNDVCTEILRREGLLESMIVPQISLANWRSALEGIRRAYGCVCLVEAGGGDVWMGRILACDDEGVTLRPLSFEGEWEPVERFCYEEIECVDFGTRYTMALSRHLPAEPKGDWI